MKIEAVRLRRSNFFISVGLGMLLMAVTTVLTLFFLGAHPMPARENLVVGPVNLVDVETRTLRENYYVRISDGLITGLSAEPFAESEIADFDRIDASNQYLIPGFIDAQVGFPAEQSDQKTALENMWNDALGNPETRKRLLRMGITSINIFGSQTEDGDPFLNNSPGRILESPGVLVAGPVISAHAWAQENSRAIPVDAVGRYLENNITRINSRIFQLIYSNAATAGKPDGNFADPATLKIVLEEADKWNFEVIAQTTNTTDVLACLDAGVTMIECGVLNEPISDSVLVRMKKNGVLFIPSLAFVATMDLWEDSTARKIVQQNVRSIHTAGIEIAAFNAMTRSRIARKLVAELKLLTACGIDPGVVLSAASIINARCLGRDKEIGSIRPGKAADFIILQENPLVSLDNLQSILYIVSRGSVVLRPRRTGLFTL